MGKIITYKNEPGYCFSQIGFESGERVLVSISTEEFTVKIFDLASDGTTPTRIVFSIDLSKATDIFLNKEDWGKKQGTILDKVIEAIQGTASIENMNTQLDELVATKTKKISI